MNLRERLADWISGGELSRLRHAENYWFEAALDLRPHNDGKLPAAVIFERALQKIAACETPGANATVRRMARIAREALE